MGPQLENLVETAGHAVFTVDHNAVLIWKQPPVVEGVEACRRLFGLLRVRRPKEKFGYLTIVESRAGTNMPADVREALSAMLRDYQQYIAAAAIVFEGTGFRASIVRSVVSAITLASRLDFASTVESDLKVGLRWLVERLGKEARVTSGDLLSLVREFRGRPGYEARPV